MPHKEKSRSNSNKKLNAIIEKSSAIVTSILEAIQLLQAYYRLLIEIAFSQTASSANSQAQIRAYQNRLVQQTRIAGNVFSRYYGPTVGSQIQALFAQVFGNIGQIIQLVTLTGGNPNDPRLMAGLNQFLQAFDQIALILANANPFIDSQTLRTLFENCVRAVFNETITYFNTVNSSRPNWASEVATSDAEFRAFFALNNYIGTKTAIFVLNKKTNKRKDEDSSSDSD